LAAAFAGDGLPGCLAVGGRAGRRGGGGGGGRLEIMRWVTALRRVSVRIRTITFRVALTRRVVWRGGTLGVVPLVT
jgi:hypothetical protein